MYLKIFALAAFYFAKGHLQTIKSMGRSLEEIIFIGGDKNIQVTAIL